MPFCHTPPEPLTCPLCERAGRDSAFALALSRVPAPKARPARVAAVACAHLGGPTGEARQCPTCAGRVEVKLLACAVHGSCTPVKRVGGVACCRDCPDNTTRAPAVPLVVVPQPPPLALSSWSSRAVVTVVAGAEAEALHEVSGPLQRAYAERLGADYVVCRWPGHPDWPMSAKYGAARALDHYDRIAYVDADVLPRPGCVDLFAMCDPDEFGAVDELPYSRAHPEYGQERRYVGFRKRAGYAPLEVPWYLNAGVLVASREHQPFLLPPDHPLKPGHNEEQDALNARLHDATLAGTVKYRLLDRRSNWQSWCSAPDFADAPHDALLHFSGGGEMRKWRLQGMQRRAV